LILILEIEESNLIIKIIHYTGKRLPMGIYFIHVAVGRFIILM